MDSAYYQSLFVQPPVVLGVKLRPLSCYHIAALEMIESPYMFKDAEHTLDDLVAAVFICSNTFKDGPPELFPDLNTEALGSLRLDTTQDFSLQDDLFDAYLEDYLDNLPQIWLKDTDTRETTVPEVFSLVSLVLQNMNGITHNEAWDMSIALMAGYRCTILEARGCETLTPKEVQAIALANKLNAEAEARAEGHDNGEA